MAAEAHWHDGSALYVYVPMPYMLKFRAMLGIATSSEV